MDNVNRLEVTQEMDEASKTASKLSNKIEAEQIHFPNLTQHGLLLNASATGDLDSTGRNNAATGFQSSPAGQSMVTGRTLKPPPFSVPPKQPTSPDDWSPENIYGTVDNWQQLRKENDELKAKVLTLMWEVEREKATNVRYLAEGRRLHQELLATNNQAMRDREQLKESQDVVSKEEEARKILQEKLQLAEELQVRVAEQHRKEMQSVTQSFADVLEVNNRLRDKLKELQQQLDLERMRHENLQQEYEQNIKQIEARARQQLQQEGANLQQQLQQERANMQQRYIQEVQQMQRVARENCARHQQPEPRSWIIQRNEVVINNNVLGSGSWGTVVEGTFRGGPVAVKQLHDLIFSAHNRELFEREMEIASHCRHPNLLQFIGATSDNENPLFVTELLDRNLRCLLDERMLNLQEIGSLALDVARGLNYLHCNEPPIVHRDIKSENVLLKRRNGFWIAKVSDFGAAHFVRRVMTPNQGTPIYSAPESGTEQYAQPADVYSFGLLVLEMCTRRIPVPEDIEQVANEPLKTFIRACIHQNPEDRPSMEGAIYFFTH